MDVNRRNSIRHDEQPNKKKKEKKSLHIHYDKQKERKTPGIKSKIDRSIDSNRNDRYASTQTQIRKKTLKIKNLPESESK